MLKTLNIFVHTFHHCFWSWLYHSYHIFYFGDRSIMGQLSVPKLWAVSVLAATFFCWLQCASYLKWLLRHNYSKLTKVDHNDSIIWTSLVVSRLWCVQPFSHSRKLYQMHANQMFTSQIKARWVRFTYFQVCTGPSQTWILHSISSWKNKDSNQIFIFQPWFSREQRLIMKGITVHFGKQAFFVFFLLRATLKDWYRSLVCTVNMKLHPTAVSA